MQDRLIATLLSALALMFAVAGASAQVPPRPPNLPAILSFEKQQADGWPTGWGGGPHGTAFVDDQVVQGGARSVRLERKADTSGGFTTMTIGFPIDFAGNTVQLRGFLRTEDASGFVGLWVREDGDSGSVAFDNMANQGLKGTTDWKEYSINLPVKTEARQLFFGVLISGTGKAWVSGMQLLVDGKPIWDAPKAVRPKTAIDLDHEFDAGSRIAASEFSAVQIQNLATTAKVWGFLKYHHPQITSGKRHWDYDLLRMIPAILAAPDRATANDALLRWLVALGEVGPCDPCAKLEDADLHLRPESAWISDKSLLGSILAGN